MEVNLDLDDVEEVRIEIEFDGLDIVIVIQIVHNQEY